jgi:hypothetical protein
MPETVTIGHVLMLLGLIAALYALWQASIWLRHRSFVRGTPQYARGRDGKRYTVWALAAAILLFALGCFTPLCEMAIA